MSEQIFPEDIGRLPMVEKVAAGVKIAMEKAGITDPADVHYVQTKTPLLTLETITDAKSRGKDVWTEDTLKSMDVSNSTTALGIAVALGEIEMPREDQIHKDLSLYSAVASCSSGVELDQAQIVVLGNVRGVGGRFRIGHSVMKDALDADGVWASIRDAGLDDLPERPRTSDLRGRVVNIFCKCEADPTGRVRDRRNIMLDDSDVHWHRQIKSCVGGVVASVTGDPAVFVSVAAVHQGPSGGGPGHRDRRAVASSRTTSASPVWPKRSYHRLTAPSAFGTSAATTSSASCSRSARTEPVMTGVASSSRSGSRLRSERSAARAVPPVATPSSTTTTVRPATSRAGRSPR